MSDRIRISRRRVMQMGIAAPLLALEARGGDLAEKEAEAMKLLRVPIPKEKLTEIKGRAKTFCTDKKNNCVGFDETQFGAIVLVLWDYFTGGVESGEAKIPEPGTKLSKLLDAAYEATSPETLGAKSGDLIAGRVQNWESVHKDVTNYCAFLCGVYAAEYAGIGMKITPKDYQRAFERVSSEMKKMVERIIAQGGTGRIKGGGC